MGVIKGDTRSLDNGTYQPKTVTVVAVGSMLGFQV